MYWRAQALTALDDARAEIAAATEPTIVVILTIGEADLLEERPLSVYANQNWRWLQRVMAFAAWRFSLRDEDAASPPSPLQDRDGEVNRG